MLCCPREFSLYMHMSGPGVAIVIGGTDLVHSGLLGTLGTLERIEENMENRRGNGVQEMEAEGHKDKHGTKK